ncbi:MAG: helix-turn-helix domain-containing protein [Bacteroidota bacterium]
MKNINTVRLIFGFKVSYLRQEKGLSYSQLSQKTGLSLSYLHDIEKGKKYPKADKILALAEALEVSYDDLVSLRANKKLQPVIDLLHSDFLKVFPLEMFGLQPSKLLELFVNTPDKVNAFVSTIIKIVRNYRLRGEDFYRAALRSYQDMHENYFPDLEIAAVELCQEKEIKSWEILTTKRLEQILEEKFQIKVNRRYLPQQKKLRKIRSLFIPKDQLLLLNGDLDSSQENFLLAKEIGYQCINPKLRPYETRMIGVRSFEKLLANFQASYFADALVMNEMEMIKDIRQLADATEWHPKLLTRLLAKYNVTPEMLMQRLANLLPKHFDINNLFFVRMYGGADLRTYEMTKEMHLSQLHSPHASSSGDEHYCRRWISVNIIRRMKATLHLDERDSPIIFADAQISSYWQTDKEYLCMSIAKPDKEYPSESVSVTIGLLITEKLRSLFRFISDPKLRIKKVHTTCERCGVPDCMARAAPPVTIEREQRMQNLTTIMEQLHEEGISVEH